MDRSFLSQPEVIAASRQFVCVRLATYEDRDENAFLKTVTPTRSDEVENTVFTILSPDGKRQLVRGSRSARQTLGDAGQMARTMNRVAGDIGAKAATERPFLELPLVPNLRLAVNVAACDNVPLVVLHAGTEKTRRVLEERLAALGWREPFLGRFVFVTVSDARELGAIEGSRTDAGILVVQPDRFGQKGAVLQQVGAEASPEALVKCLQEGAALYRRVDKTFANHVRTGQQKGVFWETVLPVTDPMERQARERGRNQGSRPE